MRCSLRQRRETGASPVIRPWTSSAPSSSDARKNGREGRAALPFAFEGVRGKSGSRRQLDRETGADRRPALGFDPTAEGFDDAPSQGKAEARAGARARGVGPEEWLEHPLEILGR